MPAAAVMRAAHFACSQILESRACLNDSLDPTSVNVVAPRDVEMLEFRAIGRNDAHGGIRCTRKPGEVKMHEPVVCNIQLPQPCQPKQRGWKFCNA